MNIARYSFLMILLILAVSCRRYDDRKAMVSVPEMRNKACADVLGNALSRIPGIRRNSIELDVRQRRITLIYDSITLSLKNVEFVVAKCGFEANGVPGDARARAALPSACGFQAKNLAPEPPPPADPVKSVE